MSVKRTPPRLCNAIEKEEPPPLSHLTVSTRGTASPRPCVIVHMWALDIG